MSSIFDSSVGLKSPEMQEQMRTAEHDNGSSILMQVASRTATEVRLPSRSSQINSNPLRSSLVCCSHAPGPSSSTSRSIEIGQRRSSTDTLDPRIVITYDEKRKPLYSCSECGQASNRKSNLVSHLETHELKRPKPYHCNVGNCSSKFGRRNDLKRHIERVHSASVNRQLIEPSI